MTVVQPISLPQCQKELASIRIGRPSIGHRQESLSGMSQYKLFVLEGASVYALPPCPVPACEVSAL
eukprot:CAMPEP_0185780056 /NCGR_PEP_ID=MMETSP1174-20130828/97880_1 /TAXON_ID=35687 /ORGANISM="Dictyocha speculum, Strain CCMP1381" /LENGTH=65 /DNA_ID=CAMNT_0028469455 /DNA_START=256 /DNA_END=453 /DNA_ORIENTATION=-